MTAAATPGRGSAPACARQNPIVNPMNSQFPHALPAALSSRSHRALWWRTWLLALNLVSLLQAQTGAAGRIVGRIFNPATQEYVRNAEVRVEGTDLVTYSGADGGYELAGVPAGSVSLVVIYTGYEKAVASVSVSAGQSARRDFELKGATYGKGGNADAVVLGAFVVSTEREGNAKAIMEQRAALNVKSVVAADNFGDVTGGNIGEFIKYLPGVVMDYNNSDARTARIGGLDPKYAAVSVDGMSMANAASAGFGSGSRAFEFEQASIYGTEAIEINKTSTASMDADAPAGRINLRSRNAFDRKGREVTAQVTLTGNEYALRVKKTPGPYEGDTFKIRPGFVFSYAEAFQQRFGVQLTLGANSLYTEQAGVTNIYNYADPIRGPVVTEIQFRDAPKLTTRAAFNLNTDFKLTPKLVFTLRTSGSRLDDDTNNRQFIMTANAAQIDPSSTLTRVVAAPTANANTRVQHTTSRRNKVNNTVTYTPKLDYKWNDLRLTLGGGYSRSRTSYEQFREGYFTNVINRVTRMGWSAQRSSERELDWHIEQTAGLPWTDPASYNRQDALANNAVADPQAGRNQVWVGYLDAKKTLDLGLPIELGAGLKTKLNVYDLERTGAQQWTYVGPTGSQLHPSTVIPTYTRYRFDPKQGGNVPKLGLPLPDPYSLYDLFAANPSHFAPNTITNYINENYSSRSIKEQIDAAYLEANTRWRALRLNLGVRHEATRTVGKIQNLVPTAQLRAAGLVPNTLPFVDAQYRNGEREKRYGEYGNTFFSGGARYAFKENFNIQVAASQSISRPGYDNLAGTITVNETAQTVRIPNANLEPETSDKFFVSLQYFLEPAGTLSLSGYQLWVENMGSALTSLTPEQAGYADDPEYAGYTFLLPMNAPGTQRIDGVDLEYSQQLVFLPGAWRGLSVFGSISRTRVGMRLLQHVPKSANGGIRFSNYRFNVQLRCTWNAPRLSSINATTGEEIWQYERLMFDLSGGFKLSQTYEITLTGRNILNSPGASYPNEPGRLRSRTNFGAAWTLGIRGRW